MDDPHTDLTAERIRTEHDGLGPLVALLPEIGLTANQRKALSAYLFLDGPDIVLAVTDGLITSPDVFSDEVQVGTALRERFDRSRALRFLENFLLTAARRAGELALVDHAACVKGCLAILKEARENEGRPGGRLRADRLRAGQRFVDKRHAVVKKGIKLAVSRRALLKATEAGQDPQEE